MAFLKNGSEKPNKSSVGNFVYCSNNSSFYIKPFQLGTIQDYSLVGRKASSKFKYLQSYLSEILPYIRLGFKNYHDAWTSNSSAMSYNLEHAIIETDHGHTINWSEFSISRGFQNPITRFKIKVNEESNSIKIKWDYNKGFASSLGMLEYRVMILLQPEDNQLNKIFGLVNGNFLKDQQQELFFKKNTVKDIYHVYISFLSNDGSFECSDSMYLGKL